uniref:Photosystem II 10 kDa polypeptide, chloroplastic n=1 Tax=Aegilops tauschii subsp. strangulata TaxID=200361 RepID=A0A453BNB1_AEGTS
MCFLTNKYHYSSLNIAHFYQGKGVYQFASKYGANVDGYR